MWQRLCMNTVFRIIVRLRICPYLSTKYIENVTQLDHYVLVYHVNFLFLTDCNDYLAQFQNLNHVYYIPMYSFEQMV